MIDFANSPDPLELTGRARWCHFGQHQQQHRQLHGNAGIYAISGGITNTTALSNTGFDLFANTGVVAFCKAGTTASSGTQTGNFTREMLYPSSVGQTLPAGGDFYSLGGCLSTATG